MTTLERKYLSHSCPIGFRFQWDRDGGPLAPVLSYAYIGRRNGLPLFAEWEAFCSDNLWSARLETVAAEAWDRDRAESLAEWERIAREGVHTERKGAE